MSSGNRLRVDPRWLLRRVARSARAQLPQERRRREFNAWLAAAEREYNRLTRALLTAVLKQDSNCIDIGASEGEVLADIVELSPCGNHIAYEALPDYATRLRQRFPGVLVRNAAVSDCRGVVPFARVANAPGWSSLRPYDTPFEAQVEEIGVDAVRLDADLPDGYVPTLIKVDVNGAEAKVFEGAIETIRRHRPTLVFEHGLAARAFGTTADDVYDILVERCGLRISTLHGEPLDRAAFAASRHWNFVATA